MLNHIIFRVPFVFVQQLIWWTFHWSTPKFIFVVCSIGKYKDTDELSIDKLHSFFWLIYEQKMNWMRRSKRLVVKVHKVPRAMTILCWKSWKLIRSTVPLPREHIQFRQKLLLRLNTSLSLTRLRHFLTSEDRCWIFQIIVNNNKKNKFNTKYIIIVIFNNKK